MNMAAVMTTMVRMDKSTWILLLRGAKGARKELIYIGDYHGLS